MLFYVAARNKPALLMAGVLDTVLLLTSSETMAVVFKLLGVLRMLVDGQGETQGHFCISLSNVGSARQNENFIADTLQASS